MRFDGREHQLSQAPGAVQLRAGGATWCLRVSTILSGLLLTSSLALAQAPLPAPTPYTAEYRARSMGLSTDAYRELRQLENGNYNLRHGLDLSVLGATLISVEESTLFEWSDRGAVPLAYGYQQGGIRDRDESISFDWAAGSAELRRDENRQQLSLPAGIQDNLSVTAQMSAELQRLAESDGIESALGTSLHFTMIDSREIDQHEYALLSLETMTTPVGELQTLKLERVREPDSDRSTVLWLALDYEFALARLEQVEDGTRTELALTSITMDP
ncbi:DUF3108 domain-containing protein [Pseudohongiella sp. O18]|uniref:DUF3108 domain-containing protein n=1 Tax=Pseudohongiella sp. O18 TaxID=2904248 RepID=UPI001F1922B1|nr:DUF3108 domain-containing protein [Pseudohongiella sp. O18]